MPSTYSGSTSQPVRSMRPAAPAPLPTARTTPTSTPTTRTTPSGRTPRAGGVRVTPFAATGAASGGGEQKPASLFGQVKRAVAGVPQGIAGLVGQTAVQFAFAPRMAVDLARGNLAREWHEGGFRGVMNEYQPLSESLYTSIAEGTVPRVLDLAHGDLSEYREAIRSGHIVDVALEDVGNVALVGGVAGKVLGTVGSTVAASDAAVAGAIDGTSTAGAARTLSSAGSALAEDAPTIRAPAATAGEGARVYDLAAERAARASLDVEPGAAASGPAELVEAGHQATIRGTGLAGYAERAGLETAAQRLAEAGKRVRQVSGWGDAISDAPLTLPLRSAGWAARRLGIPQTASRLGLAAVRQAAEGEGVFSDFAKRWTPEYRAGSQLTADTEAQLHRDVVTDQRRILQSPVEAQRYGLSPDQAMAATIGVDQRFLTFVDNYRTLRDQGRDADSLMRGVIDESYENLPGDVRLSVDHVKEYVDWQDGNVPAEVAEGMARVEETLRRHGQFTTERKLERNVIGEEQVGNEMMPRRMAELRRGVERPRNIAERKAGKAQVEAERAMRAVDIEEALKTPPPPPKPRAFTKVGEQAGRLRERAQAARRELRNAQNELARSERDYASLDAGDIETGEGRRLAAAVEDRRVRAEKLRDEITRIERGKRSVIPLSRVKGIRKISEEVVGSRRPDVDITPEHNVTAVRAAHKAVRDDLADNARGYIDSLTGGERLRSPGKINPATMGGEWDAWKGLSPGEKAMLTGGTTGEKWARPDLIGDEAGLMPDQFAQHMSERLGRDLSVDEAVRLYVDAIRSYNEMKSGGNTLATARIADQLGIDPSLVDIAVNKTAAEFQAALNQDAMRALDDVQSAFQQMEPTVSGSLLDGLREMRESGASEVELEDYMEAAFGSDASGVLGPIWGKVPMADVVDWLTGGKPSPAIYESVLGPRSRSAERMIARMQQQVIDLRGQLADVQQDRATLHSIYAQGQRSAERQARRRMGTAANAVERRTETVAKINAAGKEWGKEVKAALDSHRPYQRRRVSVAQIKRIMADPELTPEQKRLRSAAISDPLSPHERAIYRLGGMRDRALSKVAIQRRAAREAARWNEKVASLPAELGRSAQEVLRTDINAPAIKRVQSVLRRVERELGDVQEYGDGTPYLTGVMGDLADKYGIEERVLYALDEERLADGTLDPDGKRRGFQTALDAIGGELERQDFLLIERSYNVDQMLHDMGQRVAEGDANGTGASTPLRLRDYFNATRLDRMLPQDTINAVDGIFEQYMKKRAAHLDNTFSNSLAVMPTPWRNIGQNSLRNVRGLLGQAEKFYEAGDHETAAVLITMAEDVPTSLHQLVASGFDPVHLTGGLPPTRAAGGAMGSGSSIRARRLRASAESTTGLRPTSLQGVAAIEMEEAGKLITNRVAEELKGKLGREVSTVIPEAVDAWRAKYPDDLIIPEQELRDQLRRAGWTPMPGDTGGVTLSSAVIPSALADQLRHYQDDGGLVWRGLHGVNRAFKTSVLPLSPKWHIGNIIGNALMATVYGGLSPIELGRLVNEIAQREGGWKAFYANSGLAEWAPADLMTHGFTYNEHVLRWGEAKPDVDVGRARQTFRNFVANSYNLNEFFDNAGRNAVYLSGLRKGMSEEQALAHSLRAMGDFTRMTPFERRWLREVFPFYTWIRHQTVAAVHLHLHHPMRAAMLYHLTNMMNDPEYGPEMLGQLGSRVHIGGDSYIDLGGLSPFPNLLDLPLDPSSPDFLANTSLGIKLPFQIATGQTISSAGQFQAISRPPDDRATGLFGQDIARSPVRRLFTDPIHGLGEIAYQVTGALPQPALLRDLALDATGANLGDFRYQSGDRGPAKYNRPRSLASAVAGGLRTPWTQQVDIDKMLRDQAQRNG